jgi:HlyD family secretion protein
MISLKDLPSKVSAATPLLITGVAALMVGAIGGRSFLATSASTPTPQATVQATTIATVTALGRLEPKGEIISVSAPNGNDTSRLERLKVKLGDRVTKGDILAVLNSESRLKASLQQSQEQVRVAQAKLAQVRSGAKGGELQAQRSEIARLEAERTGDFNTQSAVVARLEADISGVSTTRKATRERLIAEYDNAKLEADRYEQLYQAGATSASLRDSKRLTLQTTKRRLEEANSESDRTLNTLNQQLAEARAARSRSENARAEQVDSASATLDRIAEVRPVDIQTAEAEVSSAIAAVEKAQAELDQAYVRAPQNGTVLKINTREGEKIATAGILDMGQTQNMTAIVEVYESDMKQIKVGQSAVVVSSAIGDELQGTVREIGQKVLRQNVVNTDPTTNTDSRVMEVRIELNTDSSQKAKHFTNSQVTAKIAI